MALTIGAHFDEFGQPDDQSSNAAKLSEETVKALATEVWRERRRRRLPYKIWTEASRAWRRLKTR
jgi:hypothetical protein